MGLGRRYSTGVAMGLCAVLTASVFATSAQAQGQGQPPPVAGQPPPLSAVPYILHIQPDQRDAWRAYSDAIAQDRATHPNPADMAEKLNLMQTPARLDAMLDQMKSDEAAFQRRAAATKAFYGVLTPDQKQTFDSITRLPTQPPQTRRAPPPSSYRAPQSSLPQPPNPETLPPPAGPPPQ